MELKTIKKVSVFGAGTMGPGLAQVFATAGYQVALCDVRKEALVIALSVIRTNLETFVERNLLSSEAAEQALNSIHPTQSIEEAGSNADVVIESIIEKKDIKKDLYEHLNGICPDRTVFLSNTSFLNIFDVMCPERLPNTAIAHWFAPPHIIPLVEVVRGPRTAQATMDFAVELLKKVDRVPVVMERFVPGFCINRILRILGREVFFLLDNGYITPEELDIAVKASIIPRAMVLGLVQRYDFTGLDLSARNLENPEYLEPPIDNAPACLVERVKNGDLGVKSGRGFFDYGGRKLEEILKDRDIELLDVLSQSKHRMTKRI